MLLALSSLASAAPLPCGTPWFLELREGPLGAAPSAPPAASKAERDAWGTYAHTLATDNFVAKWGTADAPSEADVQWVLDAFEEAWAVEIGEMGHPAPRGTDAYRFNVYIGDTGGGTPSSYGSGGYYWRDDDDYPYIVIARSSLHYADYSQGTAAHEFYHALQDVGDAYPYGDGYPSSWYWEATAEWAQAEVFPDNDTYAQFLFGYAWLPELSVSFFDYPDAGTLQEYHQYGAFIFPRFLTEYVVDRQIVVDSWVDPGGSDDPLEVLAADLDAAGIDLADVFGEFAAHNAVWDYADGAVYAQNLSDWAGWFDDDAQVEIEVDEGGTDGFVDVPDRLAPQRLAYVVVDLPADRDPLTVRFAGDAEGDEGSPADWRVTVVINDGGPTYLPVALADGEGGVDVPEGAPAYLVVAAVPDTAVSDETFTFAYAVEPDDGSEDDSGVPARPERGDDEEDAGVACGCGVGGGASGLGAALGLALAARRRRR